MVHSTGIDLTGTQVIRDAWSAGGSKAGTEAVPARLSEELGYVGGVEGAIERLNEQEEAGVDIHNVEVDFTGDRGAFEKTLQKLVG